MFHPGAGGLLDPRANETASRLCRRARHVGRRISRAEPYVRQEVIEGQFEASLRRLHLDPEIFGLVRRAMKEGHGDEKRDREQTVARLRGEADRLQQRIDTLYVDRLDGQGTPDFRERMAKMWREERSRCLRDVEALSGASDGFVADGIALHDFARGMPIGFAQRPFAQKRTALKLLVSNSFRAGGTLPVGFRQPFATLAQIVPETMNDRMRNHSDSAAVSRVVPPARGSGANLDL